MQLIRALYFTRKFFTIAATLVVLFILSFPYSWLLPLSTGVLILLIGICFADILFLFRVQAGIRGVRSAPEKLSNGDYNTISVYLENFYLFTINVRVIDEIPHQFQNRNINFQARIKPGGTRIIDYKLRPVKRGEYNFGAVNTYVLSPIGLVSRRYSFSQNQSLPVYPSFLQLRKYELHAISNRLCIDRCVVVSFKFELSESILKHLIFSIYFIHFDCYFILNQNMVVQY